MFQKDYYINFPEYFLFIYDLNLIIIKLMSHHDILFDEIKNKLQENAKIIKKPINNIYKQYFEDTFQLKDNFGKENFKIMDGCRIFKKKNGNDGYDEAFFKTKTKRFFWQ